MAAAMGMAKAPPLPRRPRQPLLLAMIPFAQLDDPLEYFFAEHLRQRAVYAALQDFAADGSAGRSEADQVTSFLLHDLVIHHMDEDEDLFPTVRRRSRPEDNLGPVLAQLREDHRRSQAAADEIVTVLSAHPGRDPIRIEPAACKMMRRYAANEQRHLAIENGVVMVIAAARLTPGDLRRISKSMKSRRGFAV